MSATIHTRTGEPATIPASELTTLTEQLRGRVILPEDESYDQDRRLWNGTVDRRPGLIVRCHGNADVMGALRWLRERDLRFTVRAGGHNVAGLATNNGGAVLDLRPMRSVRVDPARDLVRIEGGATLGDVDRETYALGLATPSGVVSETGYAGLALHGGLGWQTRKRGLAADNIVAVDVVTADGRFLQADARNHEDLLWAIRGGGGGFGVVTGFESRLYPMPERLHVGVPVYDLDDAPAVLRFLRDYLPEAPEELMVIAALWTYPDLPDIPASRRNQDALFVLSAFLGSPDDGRRALQPLLQHRTPAVDLSDDLSWTELQRFLDDDYPDGRRYYWKSSFADALGDSVIDSLVAQTPERPSRLSSIDVWFLGGAFGRVGAADTAFGVRDAPVLVNYEANWEQPSDDAANIAWARESLGQVVTEARTRTYLNFPGEKTEDTQAARASFGGNYERLLQVKERYDPEHRLESLAIPAA